jgi:hypothetical protein
MSRLNLGKPFRATREIDIGTMQVFIKACVGLGSLVVDLNYGLGHYKSFSFFTFE